MWSNFSLGERTFTARGLALPIPRTSRVPTIQRISLQTPNPTPAFASQSHTSIATPSALPSTAAHRRRLHASPSPPSCPSVFSHPPRSPHPLGSLPLHHRSLPPCSCGPHRRPPLLLGPSTMPAPSPVVSLAQDCLPPSRPQTLPGSASSASQGITSPAPSKGHRVYGPMFLLRFGFEVLAN
jgi:hypothetical protein